MEPFSYFQESPLPPTPMPEEMMYWDFPSPLPPPPPDEEMLRWAFPPTHECTDLVPATLNPPQPPPPPSNGEMLCWAFSSHAALDPPPLPFPLPEVPRSAFVRYERSDVGGEGLKSHSGGGRRKKNIHLRVIEFVKRISTIEKVDKTPAEGSRCFRHMMRERRRREKLSQCYADLHSMIVPPPKADKNSIVQSAAVYARELRGFKESLRWRNEELKKKTTSSTAEGRSEGASIKLRVGSPSSPIDSMIGALRRLKAMDAKANSIRFSFDGQELSAVMHVETKMARAEVERAVQGVLLEVERKFRSPSSLPRSNDTATHPTTWPKNLWSHESHVAYMR